MGNVAEIHDGNFKSEVVDSNLPVLVDFWATWCGPCRKLSPVIEEISQDYEGKVKFVKLNVQDNTKTAQEYSVSGLPSVMIFNKGQAVERMSGLLPKSKIISNIEKYL